MKKTILSTFLTVIMLMSGVTCSAFTTWESPRYIPADEYKTPWTEEGNPFVTYYAPWLRQLHLMTATEAQNNITNGIVGGEACQQIRQLAISPIDSNIMYLCSDTSGVYKTTDGGKHWYNTTNNAAGHDAKGLLCDKFDKDTVYVYMRKTGVHRSINGGYTWEQIVADTDKTQDIGKRSDTIVQDDAGNTYMCVGSGVYKLDRATDTLTNLTAKQFPDLAALTGNDSAEFLDIAVSPDGMIIYAVCALSKTDKVQTGLYVSEDGGDTWEIRNASADGTKTYSDLRTIAIYPADSSCKTIYAGLRITETNSETGESTTGDYNLYKSTDGGKTYTKVYRPQNLSKENVNFCGLKFGPVNASGKYPLYLHLERTVWPLRVSYNYTDSSPTFSQLYSNGHNMDANTIRAGYTGYLYQAFQPDMTTAGTNDVRVIYAASGVYEYTGTYSSDSDSCTGSSVKRITSGYSGASATDIAFDSTGRMFMSVTDVGSYVSDGTAYTAASYPTFTKGDGTKYGVRAIFDPNDNDNKHVIMYIGSTNGHGTYCGIKQSFDGGKTFEAFNEDAKLYYSQPQEDTEEGTGSDNTEEDLGNTGGESTTTDSGTATTLPWADHGNAKVLCYDNDDKNIIYSSYHNSYDNGDTWTKNDYFILDVHPTNTKLQAGITGTGESTALYKTTDGGSTWEKVMDLGFSNITDADFDLNNPNCIWLTRNNSSQSNALVHIDMSTGALTDYTSKFTYKAFRQIEINPNDPNHILVTSYPGRIVSNMKNDFKLAESYDGGQSWHTVPGLWGGDFNNIIFSPTTNEAFITGLSGTFIYDYEKFNYYQAVGLRYGGSTIMRTLPRTNAEGETVNNGEYIIAPEDVFLPAKMVFTGWTYNENTYMPGTKIEIGN